MNKYLKLVKENASIPYSEIFRDSLYEYFKTENYGRTCLLDLSKEIGISYNSLKSYIFDYAEKKYGMNRNAFEKYRKEQREKNKDCYIGIENFILKKYGIETKFLYRNEGEKELVLKELYKISSKDKFSLKTTKEMSEKLKITQNKYFDLLREYMVNYLEYNKSELPDFETYNKIKGDKVRSKNEKLLNLYKKIIDFDLKDDMSSLAELIECSGYNITALNENFYLYQKFYTEEESKKFKDTYSKYREYRSNKLKLKRKEKRIEEEKEKLKGKYEEASNIIISYLKSNNISFMDFLINNNLTEEEFNDYLKSVMYNNEELYKKYLDVKDKKEEEYQNKLNNIIKEIGSRLVNGYEENGVKRKFDIIDYYLITKIPLSNLLSLSEKKLTKQQFYLLKKLKTNYKNSEKYNSLEEKEILEGRRIVGIKLDENGKMIEGTGREITIEEKENVMNYLKENEISINRMTYNAALKRYLDGFLTFNNKTLKLNS